MTTRLPIVLALLALLLSLTCASAAPAADTPSDATASAPSWSDAAKGIDVLKNETGAAVQALDREMNKSRKELSATLAGIKADAAAQRKRAAGLEARLRTLREREAELERQLQSRQAEMRKVKDTVRDNAGLLLDARLVQPALSGRPESVARLRALAKPEDFPALEDVIFLLNTALDGIAQSGRPVRGSERVHLRGGEAAEARVLRLGALEAVYAHGDETGFLTSRPGVELPLAAPYRPDGDEAAAIRAALDGAPALPLDLSGGTLLNDPPRRRTLWTTVKDGGLFLWPILLIGLAGLALVLERVLVLARVRLGGKDGAPVPGSPAARVAARMANGGTADSEAMERRMEEAILDELPPLERFLQTLRVLAAVAPLLGLLGTVSGIIKTFRIITLHGNGDPKLLSAGISEALLTTELGLIVAIPLLLCHHFLTRRMNAVVLDMESTGAALIARRAEEEAR